MKNNNMMMNMMIIILLQFAKTIVGQTGEYWGTREIHDLIGDGKDITYITDIEVTPNQLKVWASHGKSIITRKKTVVNVDKNGDEAAMTMAGKSTPQTFPNLTYVFFTPKQMKPGTVVPFYFGGAFKTKNPNFLPKQLADQMPFSTREFPRILTRFGFRQGSKQAKAVRMTLEDCEAKPNEGVIKFCSNSLESMMDNIHKLYGSSTKTVKVLSTSKLPEKTNKLQNYTIVTKPREIKGSENMVGCHLLSYPYAIFFCHRPAGATKAFELMLEGQDGNKMYAIASCHLDTFKWDEDIEAFGYLGTVPGDPVCHVLPPADLLWVPGQSVKA